jgi:hypothetical protein
MRVLTLPSNQREIRLGLTVHTVMLNLFHNPACSSTLGTLCLIQHHSLNLVPRLFKFSLVDRGLVVRGQLFDDRGGQDFREVAAGEVNVHELGRAIYDCAEALQEGAVGIGFHEGGVRLELVPNCELLALIILVDNTSGNEITYQEIPNIGILNLPTMPDMLATGLFGYCGQCLLDHFVTVAGWRVDVDASFERDLGEFGARHYEILIDV